MIAQAAYVGFDPEEEPLRVRRGYLGSDAVEAPRPRRRPSLSKLSRADVAEIKRLLGERHDTFAVARLTGFQEADVYNVLARRRRPARPSNSHTGDRA
ncbi:hypothetical protein [Methylopila sp. 73B]|uniref:hypothetical protein n=1 Tax=Methylopila sp. 73B TaxID=1120792 RepID=UPI00037664F0|nr:hypothetical protein [Methylopila sp. 73B]